MLFVPLKHCTNRNSVFVYVNFFISFAKLYCKKLYEALFSQVRSSATDAYLIYATELTGCEEIITARACSKKNPSGADGIVTWTLYL
jgi:hypothetical protein